MSEVTVVLLTSDVHDEHLVRITVQPSTGDGPRKLSQVMVDGTVTVPRTKIGPVFGQLDDAAMATVTVALLPFLGFDWG